MYQRITLFLLVVIGLTVNAQTINLRGKVANQAGEAVSNAIVELVRQGLKDTTGADGMYSITNSTATVLPPLVPQTEKILLNKGVLELTLRSPSPVKVEIFDVSGNLLKKEVLQNAASGVYRLDIAENSRTTKLLIIHASIGRRVVTFRYLPFQNGKLSFSPAVENITPVGGSLTKAAAEVDTLKVTAEGYKTAVAIISTYDKEVNFTLETDGGQVVSEGCGKAAPNGGEATITVGSLQRKYILTLPSNYDPDHPYVLVFVPHPLGGSMQGTVQGGYHGLLSVSNGKAIFVAPHGKDGGGMRGFSNTNGEDIEYFKAMYDRFMSTLCIDKKRIFSTGFSFGGMMSFAVGCAMWDKFRAIAPNSGSFVSQCDSSRQGPIAVIQSHGVNDDIMPFSMGVTARNYFLKRNECSSEIHGRKNGMAGEF